jgi:hypothetical protein
MVMSWKDLFLICLILGALAMASIEWHFFGHVLFVVQHVVAAIAHTPGFLHFVSALVR